MIEKGAPWGVAVPRPERLVVVGSDAGLADIVATGGGERVAVSGGDLHRTLGSPTAAATGSAGSVRRVPMDLLRCELDGEPTIAVAHVVARRSWWRGPLRAVFNAQYLGRWDVAPRGHPNDGLAEVTEVDASMGFRQRWQARRRLPSGTHLPHPAIRSTRRSGVEWTFDQPLDVYLDGRRHPRVRSLRVAVEADAYELHL